MDASGGNLTLTSSCVATSGAGGGGRVSLEVASLAGFDPLAQVKAWAGVTDCSGTASDRFAGAGTLYYRSSGSTYGSLVIDAGDNFNATTRAARATVLPALGSGAPSSLTAAGGDAWLARSGGFAEHWLGTWVELRSAAGVLLGTYEAVERNGSAALAPGRRLRARWRRPSTAASTASTRSRPCAAPASRSPTRYSRAPPWCSTAAAASARFTRPRCG